jgi:hypothetical protein
MPVHPTHPRPKLTGDRVRVTVAGYGDSGREGVIDLEAGVVFRTPSWTPEPAQPARIAAARAAAKALVDKGERDIQATQFTHGELRFDITLDGQFFSVTYSDDGSGYMNDALRTLSALAFHGPTDTPGAPSR